MAKALTLADARACVLAAARPLAAIDTVGLDAVHGRVLARDVVTAAPWPTTDRSAMDGFAVVAGAAGLAAGATLPVVGESLAGTPFAGALTAGAAIRIMTGAVVPAGADAVVPVEQTSGFAGATVTLSAPVQRGQHVRPCGSELGAGATVLTAGTRLRAAEVGALAVLGVVRVPVTARAVVAIVATGDEVVAVEREPAPHQVRESNSWALAAQVHECGAVARRLGIAPDEPHALRALLAAGLADADVLVTIGGVSKGTHDLVHGELAALGVHTTFHGIDLKPGKPTFFGVHDAPGGGRRCLVFGLPGNPASSVTVFDLLVRPALAALHGLPPAPQLVVPHTGAAWRTNARLQAIPATLRASEHGVVAELAAVSPSGDPFGLLRRDCYALVPPSAVAADTPTVEIVRSSAGVLLP